MASMHVAGLYVHPVKGLARVAVDRAVIEARGLAGDRRFMVVDARGVFLSQREIPKMTLVRAELSDAALVLMTPGRAPCSVARIPVGARARVRVWDDEVDAVDAGDEAAGWLSAALDTDVRLVHMPDGVHRPVDPAYARTPDEHVSFADGFPILATQQESLGELNRRIRERAEEAVGMDRFRPNLVIAGGAPFDEDGWRELTIGGVVLRSAKPCIRCVVTTTDPRTGDRGKEPLATLATFRHAGAGVRFGINLVPVRTGEIRVGDEVLAD